MLLPQEIIRTKRDGGALSPEAIDAFIGGLTRGEIGEGQIGAFAMAVYLNGMSAAETVALTLAMRDSGRVLRWDDLPGPTVDKHSTGGIGDKTSLVLAPLLAACGAFVPMLSGRGLGHTGGTLDKLEAIPGYRTRLEIDDLRRVVRSVGCAIVGQTDDLAPADRRLYAVRDVTATVESMPLITASILSKKLAAGPSSLVMNVKSGSGAFMRAHEDARELARMIVEVARGAGQACTALLTDMGQCLGGTVGNALEVEECVAWLKGGVPDRRLARVTLALAAEALVLAGLAADTAAATAMAEDALASGRAAERFAAMVAAQGGPVDLLERPQAHLQAAPVRRAVPPPFAGIVQRIDARALGLAVVALGGGRVRVEHAIDPRVGLSDVASIGEPVGAGEPLAIVHAADDASADHAAARVVAAYTLADEPVPPTDPVYERLG